MLIVGNGSSVWIVGGKNRPASNPVRFHPRVPKLSAATIVAAAAHGRVCCSKLPNPTFSCFPSFYSKVAKLR